MKKKSKKSVVKKLPPKIFLPRFHVKHETFNISKYRIRGYTSKGKAVEIKPILSKTKSKKVFKISGYTIPKNVKTLKVFQGKRLISKQSVKKTKGKKSFKAAALKKLFFDTGRPNTPSGAEFLTDYLQNTLGESEIQSGILPMNHFIKNNEFINNPAAAGKKHSKWIIYIAVQGERYSGDGKAFQPDSIGWHIIKISQNLSPPLTANQFIDNIQGLVGSVVQDTVDLHNAGLGEEISDGEREGGRVLTEWRGQDYRILGAEASDGPM